LLAIAGTLAHSRASDLRSPGQPSRGSNPHRPTHPVRRAPEDGALLQDNPLSLNIDHKTLGVNAKVRAAKLAVMTDRGTAGTAEVRSRFERTTTRCAWKWKRIHVFFRAYNEGVAYRFETALPQPQVKVYGEEVRFNFPGDSIVFYPQEDSIFPTMNASIFHSI